MSVFPAKLSSISHQQSAFSQKMTKLIADG